MAKIIINGKVFDARPLWDEFLLATDFTSAKGSPFLHDYFIDNVKVTKKEFDKEYQIARSNL